MPRWWLLPLLLASAGCSTARSMESAHTAVEAVARFELQCPQVNVVELGEPVELFGVYDQILGVYGCDRRAVYLVVCANGLCGVEID